MTSSLTSALAIAAASAGPARNQTNSESAVTSALSVVDADPAITPSRGAVDAESATVPTQVAVDTRSDNIWYLAELKEFHSLKRLEKSLKDEEINLLKKELEKSQEVALRYIWAHSEMENKNKEAAAEIKKLRKEVIARDDEIESLRHELNTTKADSNSLLMSGMKKEREKNKKVATDMRRLEYKIAGLEQDIEVTREDLEDSTMHVHELLVDNHLLNTELDMFGKVCPQISALCTKIMDLEQSLNRSKKFKRYPVPTARIVLRRRPWIRRRKPKTYVQQNRPSLSASEKESSNDTNRHWGLRLLPCLFWSFFILYGFTWLFLKIPSYGPQENTWSWPDDPDPLTTDLIVTEVDDLEKGIVVYESNVWQQLQVQFSSEFSCNWQQAGRPPSSGILLTTSFTDKYLEGVFGNTSDTSTPQNSFDSLTEKISDVYFNYWPSVFTFPGKSTREQITKGLYHVAGVSALGAAAYLLLS